MATAGRALVLFLVLVLCLEAALAGRGRQGRGGRGRGRKGPRRGHKFGGYQHGTLPKLPHDLPYEWRGHHRGRPEGEHSRRTFPKQGSTYQKQMKCRQLSLLVRTANQSSHKQPKALNRLFAVLVHRAGHEPGFSGRRRGSFKHTATGRGNLVVAHQCDRTMLRMAKTIQNCNYSGLQSFERVWHHAHKHLNRKLSKLALKLGYPNATLLCPIKPRGFRIRSRPHVVRRTCQRLDLVKCIFQKTNMTLPQVVLGPATNTSRPNVWSGFKRNRKPTRRGKKKKKYRYFRGRSKSFLAPGGLKTTQDNTASPPPHHHRRWRKSALLVLGVGTLLLLTLTTLLAFCYCRYRKKLQAREERVHRLETVAASDGIWKTPPDSTVAWLQAKGWHNPVYYALEEEAAGIKPKVAI